MKQSNVYLAFNGNCREAMNFYKKCFNCSLEMMTYADSKMECPESQKNLIMHASLTSKTTFLMASDGMEDYKPGNNFSIMISCETEAEQNDLFAKLAANGKVTMPLEETFWKARFGMITDMYGTSWMLNLDRS